MPLYQSAGTTGDELSWLGVAEASDRLRTREVSSEELTQAALARITEADPILHAFISVDEKGALDAARRADAELAHGTDRGSLHGIPLSLKDQFATKDLRTTNASLVYEDWVPDFDSAAAERIRRAGAVLLGKTNMFELSTGWGTVGSFKLAINPWDVARTPGGSSSGSAVAVASGMGCASVGSDSGGSTRVPANYCGVVGLKPSYGIVSCFGTIPVGPSTSHVGVITRGVEDAALILQALVGFDSRDPVSLKFDAPDYRRSLVGNASGLRIGVPWEYIGGFISDENRAAFDAALEVMRDAGAVVDDIQLPNLDRAPQIWTTIVFAELAAYHEARYKTDPALFGFELKTRLDAGLATTAAEYIQAQDVRSEIKQAYAEALRSFDLIATPTAPAEAPTITQLVLREQTARQTRLADVGQLGRYTRPYNLTGLPAITVPSGFTSGGMPLGFQLAGRPLSDSMVLQAADAFERRTSWHRQRPGAVSTG